MQSPAQATICSRTRTLRRRRHWVRPASGERSIRRAALQRDRHRRCPGAPAPAAGSGQAGSVSRNVVQPPSLVTPTRPPASSTSCFTIASPMPGAAAGAVARLLDAVEALPDARQVLGRDPGAGVRDPERAPSATRVGGDLDAAARGRVADRVLEQVREHLGELVGADADLAAPGRRPRSSRSTAARRTGPRGRPRPGPGAQVDVARERPAAPRRRRARPARPRAASAGRPPRAASRTSRGRAG